MKLKIVAVVVTGLLAANVAHAAEVYNKDGNKLDLYGKVTALRYFTDDKRDDGDKTYARLGFKGETQINDQMIGFGHWEYDFKGYNDEANGSRGNKTRLAYAGLKISEFGSLDYGRNYGVGYDIGSWTDMLPEFGGDTWSQKDVFMTYRTTGVATYRNYDFFGLIEGLNFAAQYQGKNERTDNGHLYGADYTRANGDGFGISSTYVYDGFGIGAVYTKSDRTNAQERAAANPLNASGKNAELWATGIKYDANNIYFAANYAETLNMTTYGDGYISNKAQSNDSMSIRYRSKYYSREYALIEEETIFSDAELKAILPMHRMYGVGDYKSNSSSLPSHSGLKDPTGTPVCYYIHNEDKPSLGYGSTPNNWLSQFFSTEL